MQQATVSLDSLTLVGLKIRTNNGAELQPHTAKIGAVMQRYWGEQLANLIAHRLTPGVTYAVYTDYDSDEHGDYSYFLGEAVTSLAQQDLSIFSTLAIAAATYQKFTTPAGPMPRIVIDAWQTIWRMTPAEWQGKRAYRADFEIYDHRSTNPSRSIIDIYIGVQA